MTEAILMPPAEDAGEAMTRPALAWIFVIAFFLRAAVFLTASRHHAIPLQAYAAKGDGASYLAYAHAIRGNFSYLTEYDRRVFPGYPLLIALASLTGLSMPIAALLIDWVSAAVACVAAACVFPDRRVAWAMVFLVPHYLCNSSLAMSEAPLLAFTLCGLCCAIRKRALLGGVLLGGAMLIRPMGCFATLGLWTALLAGRNWRALFRSGLACAIILLLGMLALHRFNGGVLRGMRIYRDSPQAYVGQIFQWPFQSLLTTPWREHDSAGFMIYIYVHVLIVLLACALSLSSLKHRPDRLTCLAACWLVSNTLFQLCIGSGWGFRHFPRFAIPAQPALFWTLKPWLPKSKWMWIAGGAGVFVLAVVSVARSP